ncbi:MAG TPA: GNAT family N-acetyltransferase, partial [Candidatus Gastranaerophilaceae bacterium]|nr:GNAT family N-acetyltransferase [Candidatus Gastranaerophilaceae bacterium]
YYLFGANDPEYRNLFGGNFLMLNMIRDAFENDIEKIDFVGVNSPNRGDYKLSYNGELKPYFILKLEE